MKFTIITLFPEMFSGVFGSSIIKRAQKDKKIEISFLNLRDFGIGKHKVVDDKEYGGGVGMLLRVDVLDKAIQAARTHVPGEKIILLDPKGKTFFQETAERFVEIPHLILICGHYEGYDERIRKLIDEEISIGDYILSGGEIAAMAIVESVARLVEGVIKKEEATAIESFSLVDGKRILEHHHFTRPRVYKRMQVPQVLLSGNREKIEKHRKTVALKITKKNRPDVLS